MSWCLGRSWKTRKGQGHSGSCVGENINWLLLKLCQKWSVRAVITGVGCLPFYSKLIVKGKFLDFKAWHHNVRQLYRGGKPCNCCGVKPRAPFSFERDTNLPLRWHGFSFVICFAILTVLMGSLGLWDVFRAPAELTPKAQRGSSAEELGSSLLSHPRFVFTDIFHNYNLWQTCRTCCCPPWKYSIELDQDSRFLHFSW